MGNRSEREPINIKVKVHIDFKPQISISNTETAADSQILENLLEEKMKSLVETLKDIQVRDVDVFYNGQERKVKPLLVFDSLDDEK